MRPSLASQFEIERRIDTRNNFDLFEAHLAHKRGNPKDRVVIREPLQMASNPQQVMGAQSAVQTFGGQWRTAEFNPFRSVEEIGQGYSLFSIIEEAPTDTFTVAEVIYKKNFNVEFLKVLVKSLLYALVKIHRNNQLHLNICPESIRIRGTVPNISVLLGGLHYVQSKANVTYFPGDKIYSAPEALDEEKQASLTEAADIYSVGMVAYLVALGERASMPDIHPAFRGKPPLAEWRPQDWQSFKAPDGGDFPSLNAINPDFSPTMARLIAKMIRRKPEDRYATSEEVLTSWVHETVNIISDISGDGMDRPGGSGQGGDIKVVETGKGRRRLYFSGAAAVAVIVCLLIGWKFVGDRRKSTSDQYVTEISHKREEAKKLGAPLYDPAQTVGRSWRQHEEELAKYNGLLATERFGEANDAAPEVLRSIDRVLTDLGDFDAQQRGRAEAIAAAVKALAESGVAPSDLVEVRTAFTAVEEAAKTKNGSVWKARLDDAATALKRVHQEVAHRRIESAGAAAVRQLRDGSAPKRTLERVDGAVRTMNDALAKETYAPASTAFSGLSTLLDELVKDLRDLRARIDKDHADAQRELTVLQATLPADSDVLASHVERMRKAEALLVAGDLDGADEIFVDVVRTAGQVSGTVRSAQERAEAVHARILQTHKVAVSVVGDGDAALNRAESLDAEATALAKTRRWAEAEDGWGKAGAAYEQAARAAIKARQVEMYADLEALTNAHITGLTRRPDLIERHRRVAAAFRTLTGDADETDLASLAEKTAGLRKSLADIVGEFEGIRAEVGAERDRVDTAIATAVDLGADRLAVYSDIATRRKSVAARLEAGQLDEASDELAALSTALKNVLDDVKARRDRALEARAAFEKSASPVSAGVFAKLPEVAAIRAILADADRRIAAKSWSDASSGLEQAGPRLAAAVAAVSNAEKNLRDVTSAVAEARKAGLALKSDDRSDFRDAEALRVAGESALADKDGVTAQEKFTEALAAYAKSKSAVEDDLAELVRIRGEAVAAQRQSDEVGGARTAEHRRGASEFEAGEQKMRARDVAAAAGAYHEATRLFSEAKAVASAATAKVGRAKAEAAEAKQQAETVGADKSATFERAVGMFANGEARAGVNDVDAAVIALASARDGFVAARAEVAALRPTAEKALRDFSARLDADQKGKAASDPRFKAIVSQFAEVEEAFRRGAFAAVNERLAGFSSELNGIESRAAQMDCAVEGAPGRWARVAPGQYELGKLQSGSDFTAKIVKRAPELAGRVVNQAEFCIQTTRVSGREFQVFLDALPESERGRVLNNLGDPQRVQVGNAPIAGVPQDMAREFATWLSKKTGRTFRLPTPAEWLAGYLSTANTDRAALGSFLESGRRDWSTTVCEDQTSILTVGPVAGDRSDVAARCQQPITFGDSTTFRLVLTKE